MLREYCHNHVVVRIWMLLTPPYASRSARLYHLGARAVGRLLRHPCRQRPAGEMRTTSALVVNHASMWTRGSPAPTRTIGYFAISLHDRLPPSRGRRRPGACPNHERAAGRRAKSTKIPLSAPSAYVQSKPQSGGPCVEHTRGEALIPTKAGYGFPPEAPNILTPLIACYTWGNRFGALSSSSLAQMM